MAATITEVQEETAEAAASAELRTEAAASPARGSIRAKPDSGSAVPRDLNAKTPGPTKSAAKKPAAKSPGTKKPKATKPAGKKATSKKLTAGTASRKRRSGGKPKEGPAGVRATGSGESAGELERIGNRYVHPAASVFPLNPPAQQRALEESIRKTGLLHAIVLLGDQVLDGRNRLHACRSVGVKPNFEQVEANEDPVQYVLRANLHRRHLSGSQRAFAAARLAALGAGRPTEETRQSCRFSANESAKLFGVSARLVRSARSVRRQGVPELVRAVERGDLSVGRAESVAKVPAEQQRGLLKQFGTARNKAEKDAVFASVVARDAPSTGSKGAGVAPEEVVRTNRRASCVRRLAALLCDGQDPERELREVCRELARLVGVAESTTDGGGDSAEAPA